MDWISGVYCNSGANTIVLAAYYLCFYLLSNTLTILIHVHVNYCKYNSSSGLAAII